MASVQQSATNNKDAKVPREKLRKKDLEPSASIIEWLFLSWLTPYFILGNKRPLDDDDMPTYFANDYGQACIDRFQEIWGNNEAMKKEAAKKDDKDRSVLTMWRIYFQLLGPKILLYQFMLDICKIFTMIAAPTFLYRLLQGLEGSVQVTRPELWGYAVGIWVCPFASAVLQSLHGRLITRHACRMRNALAMKVYRDCLDMSNKARTELGTGKTVQLMAMDCEVCGNALHMMHFFIDIPIRISAVIVIVYVLIGWPAFLALLVLCIAAPLNTKGTRWFVKVRRQKVRKGDERLKLTNEVLSGIRISKYFNWGQAFVDAIQVVRNEEMDLFFKLKFIMVMFVFVPIQWMPVLMPLMALVAASMIGVTITASLAFAVMGYFNTLKWIIIIIPWFFTQMTNCQVSLRRLMNYYVKSRLEGVNELVDASDSVNGNENASSSNKAVVKFDNASFKWDEDSDKVILHDIDLKVPKGQLIAIVGPVASGKTSLLMALLGEMTSSSEGKAYKKGTVAYVGQQPWVMNRTLRDNITFLKEFDEKRYEQTISQCALGPDLKVIKGGDQAEIGERGINLSGGQKARIGMCRAVYQDREIYLLDDILSAVDAHVGSHIFKEVITGQLKGKTILFVTNALQYVNKCDRVIVLDDGKVVEDGTYDELLQKGDVEIINKAESQRTEEAEPEPNATKDLEEKDGEIETSKIVLTEGKKNTTGSDEKKNIGDEKMTGDDGKEAKRVDNKAAGTLIKAEERDTGDVKLKRYTHYIYNMGWHNLIIFLIAAFAWKLVEYSQLFIISEWSANSMRECHKQLKTSNISLNDCKLNPETSTTYATLYVASSFVCLILVITFQISFTFGNIRASKILHKALLESVIRAPTEFFDTTPLGRILVRFSSDTDRLDFMVAGGLRQTYQTTTAISLAVIGMIFVTRGIIIAAIIPVFYLYRFIARFFRASKTETQRIESLSRSLILATFTETLIGAISIRAYNAQKSFMDIVEKKFTFNTRARLTFGFGGPWLTIRMTMLSATITFSVAAIAVSCYGTDLEIDAAYVGIAIVLSLQLAQFMEGFIQQYANLETAFNAVERIQDYTDNLKHEAAPEDAEMNAPKEWPQNGQIVAKNVSMRYRQELPLVLKNLNFTVKPGEKIGVCGRTGAGKSSLMVSMFRLVEMESGSLEIDGINIQSIPLGDLRSSITIIPQDPVMYSTTIRENLDPFKKVTDEEMWDALEKCCMKENVMKLENKLSHPVAERGSNFSVGERQLICIARALLRKSKVLLLDEATASIDQATDDKIQQTIRVAFKDVTVLTIAHRLNTIIDSDKVMLMSDGKVLEFDEPKTLLDDENSSFFKLVESMGKGSAEKYKGFVKKEESD